MGNQISRYDWQRLSKSERRKIAWLVRWRYIKHKTCQPAPLAFFLRSGAFAVALLSIMPAHPMAVPAAFGGGLSLSIIWG